MRGIVQNNASEVNRFVLAQRARMHLIGQFEHSFADIHAGNRIMRTSGQANRAKAKSQELGCGPETAPSASNQSPALRSPPFAFPSV